MVVMLCKLEFLIEMSTEHHLVSRMMFAPSYIDFIHTLFLYYLHLSV